MNIARARDHAAAVAQKVKAESIRRGQPLDAFVLSFREPEPIAVVSVANDREQLIEAARLSAVGFAADLIAVCMDAAISSTLVNPETAEPWGQGEMAAFADEHPEQAKRLFQDTMIVSVFNRDGEVSHTIRAFDVNGQALSWIDWEPPPDLELGGYIDDDMRVVMEDPPMGILPPGVRLLVSDLDTLRSGVDLATAQEIRRQMGGQVQVLLHRAPESRS